jgi:asparagine synthase (glutamine-hydrolysing)
MCGIAALFSYGSSAAPLTLPELRAIRDRMALRGPDGTGEFLSADSRVALGHRRLSIIDLRAIADQPMEHDGGRLRLVFNGEIYNYKALRDELRQQGRVFKTESDTEVILQLYDRDGPDCVRRMRGMFAFALRDEARGGMLLARDPLGIKPLYVADNGKRRCRHAPRPGGSCRLLPLGQCARALHASSRHPFPASRPHAVDRP